MSAGIFDPVLNVDHAFQCLEILPSVGLESICLRLEHAAHLKPNDRGALRSSTGEDRAAVCFGPQWKKCELKTWEERARFCACAAKACQGAVRPTGARTRYSDTKNALAQSVAR
jgi:hypothetical protein